MSERVVSGSSLQGEAATSRMIAWLAAELPRALARQSDRASLWLVVCFSGGVALFFGWRFDPPVWSGPVLAACGIGLTGWPKGRHMAIVGLAVTALGCGHCAAQFRTWWVRSPLLERSLQAVDIEGLVRTAEKRPAGNRVVLAHVTLPGFPTGRAPLVRLTLPTAHGLPAVGQRIVVRATVGPVGRPVTPDGFQFQRFLYFQGIGANGFATGRWHALGSPPSLAWSERFHAWTEALRRTIGDRLAAAIPGDEGAVAAALINGEQSAIPQDLQEAYRISGIAHILSVSGVHLSLLAGIVFFAIRRALALIPAIALRIDTKKLAAAGGLAATGFYLIISGMSIPAVRSFLMVATVLVAVLIDRKALSLRNVAFAALVLLSLYPEAIFGASFQMSFLAVLALVALYEQAWIKLRWRDQYGRIPLARVGSYYFAGLVITDIAAGGATALLAAYHFNRLSTYSMVTNLVAAPLTSLWIMPAAILALMAMPFGWEFPARIMGAGVKQLDELARWVATWPGAQVHVQPMATGLIVAAVLGVIFICLWRGPARWMGLVPVMSALAQPALVPIPDLLVDDSGRVVAVSDGQGHLIIRPGRAGRFVREVWADRFTRASAEWPKPGTVDQSSGLACDRSGCILERQGMRALIATREEAILEDCGHVDVIVSALDARSSCALGVIVDRAVLNRDGATEVWLSRRGARTRSVVDALGARAWMVGSTESPGEQR